MLGISGSLDMMLSMIKSPDAKELFSPAQLDVMEFLLMRIKNMVRDGIQEHEISDLRQLLTQVMDSSDMDSQVKKFVDAINAKLEKVEKIYEQQDQGEGIAGVAGVALKAQMDPVMAGRFDVEGAASLDEAVEENTTVASIAGLSSIPAKANILSSDPRGISPESIPGLGGHSGVAASSGMSKDSSSRGFSDNLEAYIKKEDKSEISKEDLEGYFNQRTEDEKDIVIQLYNLVFNSFLEELHGELEKMLSNPGADSKKNTAANALLSSSKDLGGVH